MKNIFIFVVFFLLSANTLFAGNSDTSRRFPKIYQYGERVLRINYHGDTTYETYLLISCDSTSRTTVQRSGVGFEVYHQDVESMDTAFVWSFIGNGKKYIKKALREKSTFTIVLVQNKDGTNDGWKFIKDKDVFLY